MREIFGERAVGTITSLILSTIFYHNQSVFTLNKICGICQTPEFELRILALYLYK